MLQTTTKNGLAVQQSSHPLQKPWVKHIPKEDLFKIVLASVAKCYADLNYKEISENDKNYLVNEITDNILNHFPAIRLEEIPIAFSRGIRQHYGEFMGLSVITFEKFISAYMSSSERSELVKSLSLPEPNQEPDNLTKFNLAKENSLKALQFKLEGKDNSLYALPVYEFLNSLKLIDFSKDDKLDFLKNARKQLANETESLKNSEKDNLRRLEISRTLNRILEGNENDLVIVRAKKIALNAFYEFILLKNKDLSKMIDDRQSLYMEGLNNG